MSLYPVEIHIMRTAAELWENAGPDMWLYRWAEDGCALLQGKAARCKMTAEEFGEYQDMRVRYQKPWLADLAGAPVVSMMVVESEEEAILADLETGRPSFAKATEGTHEALSAEDRGRIYASLGTELRQIRELVSRARMSMSLDDYFEALEGAFARLSVCVGCVEGLQSRLGDGETGRRGDVERLTDINENVWLRGVILRAGDFLDAKSSWDECGKIAAEISSAAAFIRRHQEGGEA